jgi:predicted metalloprotease with PDZ domain
VLLWLDVEARLRQLTGGRAGLDDFAARFFRSGAPDGIVSTYSFRDVCDTLDGIARAGWRLVFRPVPSQTFLQDEADSGDANLSYSIGATVDEHGRVDGVSWAGPADRAGIARGARIERVCKIASNGDPT